MPAALMLSDDVHAVFRSAARARRGSVAIQLALMTTVLLGMVALGTEITFVLFKHRQMQSAADPQRSARRRR